MLINCKNCAYWFQVETQPGWGECRAVWPYTGMLDWCGDGAMRGSVKDDLEVAIPNQTASLSPNTFNEAVAKAVKKRMG
jgi:hypothetical protein